MGLIYILYYFLQGILTCYHHKLGKVSFKEREFYFMTLEEDYEKLLEANRLQAQLIEDYERE